MTAEVGITSPTVTSSSPVVARTPGPTSSTIAAAATAVTRPITAASASGCGNPLEDLAFEGREGQPERSLKVVVAVAARVERVEVVDQPPETATLDEPVDHQE